MTSYTGSYGFVLLMDSATDDRAKSFGKMLLNDSGAGGLGPPVRADYVSETIHMTLFHAKIVDAFCESVDEMLQALSILEQQEVAFRHVAIYAEKFLFWDADPSAILRAGHLTALHLSEFLDPASTSRAEDDEKLTLPADERENVRRYGHPLVRRLFRPHLTLGYDRAGFARHGIVGPYEQIARVERVAFAEIGAFGSIARIVI